MRFGSIVFLLCLFPASMFAESSSKDGAANGRPPEHDTAQNGFKQPVLMLPNAVVLKAGFARAMLKTANGCGISNFVITCAGDSTQNQQPEIWAVGDMSGGSYMAQAVPAKSALGVAFRRESFTANTSVIQSFDPQAPYMVITERGVFKYQIPNDYLLSDPGRITLTDSLLLPGIQMAAQQVTTQENNPVVLCMADSSGGQHLRFLNYPSLAESHRSPLPFHPQLMEVTASGSFVAGRDSTGTVRLIQYSNSQDSILASFTLNDSASNPQEFLSMGGLHYLLSSPGDSMTVLTSIADSNGLFTQSIILSQSGIRASHNEVRNLPLFSFQPIQDTPVGFLERQILLLNPANLALDTLIVDRKLDYFKYPETIPTGFGRFNLEWVGGLWSAVGADSAFIPTWSSPMEMPVGRKPSFVDASYGCWVHHEPSMGSEIAFTHYPNPVSQNVTIHLTGLTKGKTYRLDLLDVEGRVLQQFDLEAYESIELSLRDRPAGTYFFRLDTGDQIRIQKLLIRN